MHFPPPRPCRLLHRILAIVAAGVLAACSSLPPNVDRASSFTLAAPEQTEMGQFVAQRLRPEHARSDSGFLWLADVDSAYAARVALIRAARHTLDLQYYAIHADHSTELLLEELGRAARRGVRVRILLDDFNTVGKDAQVLRLALEPRVEIRLFNPMTGTRGSMLGHLAGSLFDEGSIGKRMHNKLFLADGSMGIAGGRNLGDAYFGADATSNFIDLDVLAAGRIVRDMSASFDRFWNDELAYPMQALVGPDELDRLERGRTRQPGLAPVEAEPAGAPPPIAAPIGAGMVLPGIERVDVTRQGRPAFDLPSVRLTWSPSVLLADEPGKIAPDDDEADAGDTVVDGLLNLVDGARREVLIVSPYFVPGALITDRLRKLAARGVRVRVLTNSLASNDAPAAHAGYARYRRELLAAGVELHELRAGEAVPATGIGAHGGMGSIGAGSSSGASRASLHSKAVMIDGRIAVIGSMNLDLRSQAKNSEVALVIRSASFTLAGTETVQRLMDRTSYRVVLRGQRLAWQAPPGAGFGDAADEPGATTLQKILARVIAPFAPDEIL
ncbi:phospholipase D family protein [Ramlibacter sp. XY19]|uniref:phospholipase D family protein n=1 Tax=Ramlibacter paludis TaxID=2908000 RepID=UPI0023DB5328|nr:phospholipase D family protein [Ramlibacter paludis]MCG2594380.1 phospholipase D family protein [Ramlibacter paludis]